jgi:hypothetical protein
VGARIRFSVPNSNYTAEAQFPKSSVSTVTDEEGKFQVELWCNSTGLSSGIKQTKYRYYEEEEHIFSFFLPPGEPIDIGPLRVASEVGSAPSTQELLLALVDSHAEIESEARTDGDSATLASANDYTDEHLADIDLSPYATTAQLNTEVGAREEVDQALQSAFNAHTSFIASADDLGHVRIGEGLVIDEDGILSLGDLDSAFATDAQVASAVSAEATLRAAADSALQTNITNEATARASADTTLQANITSEVAARAAADTSLLSSINAVADLAPKAIGNAAMVDGSVVVASSIVTANSIIHPTGQDANISGTLGISARTPGLSFTITSSNGGDNGVVGWALLEP